MFFLIKIKINCIVWINTLFISFYIWNDKNNEFIQSLASININGTKRRNIKELPNIEVWKQ